MKIGTKSLLFGAHQFVLHPLFLALAWWKLYGFPPEPGGRIMARLFGQEWGDFTRLHSRYYAKREGREPSPLCAADKLVLLVTPRWIYLPSVVATGEAAEYRALYARWLGVETVTLDEWYDGLRENWLQEVRRLAPNHAHRIEGM